MPKLTEYQLLWNDLNYKRFLLKCINIVLLATRGRKACIRWEARQMRRTLQQWLQGAG